MTIPATIGKTGSNTLKAALRTALGHPASEELMGLIFGESGRGTPGVGVTAFETSAGHLHRTRIYLNKAGTNLTMTVADSGGANGGWVGLKILDLPAGLIQFMGAITHLPLTVGAGISATGTLKHSVGTVVAGTNDTLSGTKANIIPSTDLVLVASAGTAEGKSLSAQTALTDNTAGTGNTTLQALPDPTDTPASADALRDDLVAVHWPVIRSNFADLALAVNNLITNGLDARRPTVDGTVTAVDVYLNLSAANADISANTVVTFTSEAYIDLFWINLGKPGTI